MKKALDMECFTLPGGYRAAGVHAGIKPSGDADMALFVSDLPAVVAGTFTSNQVQAAPVKLCRERLALRRPARAIVVNSGVANACTGASGLQDAARMAELTAAALEVRAEDVYVCSTGSIGKPLPMDTIAAGIDLLAAALSSEGGTAASEAILTTDTCPKRWSRILTIDGRDVTLAGTVKGAGMIEPNMATMLSFLLTDADVQPDCLQRLLSSAVSRSFNRICVDGDMSTNDSVLMLANGAAGNRALNEEHPAWATFRNAVLDMTGRLARMVVADGEGASKLVTVTVRGAASERDADAAARSVARSMLVKTGWSGSLPSWGRVMDALGYSPAQLEADRVDLWYNDLQVAAGGCSAGFDAARLNEVVSADEFCVTADLHLGEHQATVLTCDITEEYVRINNR